MKKDDAKKMSDQALAELASQLEQGRTEEYAKYLDAMSRFHNYSFGNCMLIARQKPDATLVAGFHAWKRHGRSVKKGEKGICILAPMVGKKDADESDEREVFGFRAVHVFDVSQTDGEEMPEPNRLSGEPGELLARLHQVVMSFGIAVFYDFFPDAYGVSLGGRIGLREGLSPAEEFNTLAHELGHELLHKKVERLQLSRGVKELEAESVAYVVTRAAGLANAMKHSADYICSHKGDAEMLSKSLERVQKVSTLILQSLESVELLEVSEVA
ncbi:MAG: hypothetical protein KF688_01215 [Pirellulales bacterium]|nr:hypothetical protein [Pirellulales bacterium]